MKIRVSIFTTVVLFGVITALGLSASLAVSMYANNQLRVGGPLYSQIALGKDLVADVIPPPAYVIEAFLEATLALQQPEKVAYYKGRLVQLHMKFNERQEFWQKSELETKLKTALTVKSYSEVKRFWSLIEDKMLPALVKGDQYEASFVYSQLTSVYDAHRAIVDEIVKQTNADNIELEAVAAQRIAKFSLLVWSVSGTVVLMIVLGITGIAIGVIRPMVRMTLAISQIAAGDLSIVIPGANRVDEIGNMAKAITIVRENAENKAREESEAKALQDQAAGQQRRAEMIGVADDFQEAIGKIIETVSAAAIELESSATSLSATAERSQELATTVAAASEEASTNVQSVASATEELSTSVNEISRQVQESARIAGEAVDQARFTNERVSELSKAAGRIGDVVDLINTIAGQTNLLALNATIEAARAGDAGRGFAVVASEVKALAEQTARATGEISQQISGIQAATADSVTAIGQISGTIEKLSEISSTIAAAVEEQGAATLEISRNVQQAAHGTHQVSSNIMDVQRGASETGSASSQVLSAAQMLSGDSNRLKSELGRFLESVRAA
jgi:methyl-accepting chemotaxis protein